MTAIRDRRPQDGPGSGRLAGAMRTAARGLRKVQSEQMLMWEAFYRLPPSSPAPKQPSGSSEHARPDSEREKAAAGSPAHSA